MSEDQLIGSITSEASAFTDWYGKQFWYDSRNGALAAKVVSSSLFAIDPESSKPMWTFQDQLILNSTITIAGDRVFFCQVRAPKNFDKRLMRIQDATAWDSLELVAIDRKTGKEQYRTPLPGIDLTTSLYVTASQDWLIVSGSAQGRFEVLGIKQQDGSQWWRRKIPWEADHHGKHLSRPAIAEGKVFLRPVVLQLATGEAISGERILIGDDGRSRVRGSDDGLHEVPRGAHVCIVHAHSAFHVSSCRQHDHVDPGKESVQ